MFFLISGVWGIGAAALLVSSAGCLQGQGGGFAGSGSRTDASEASLTVSGGLTLNFGQVTRGAQAEATLTLSNSGGAPATSLSGKLSAAPFAFKGGTFPGTGGSCGSSLAASATCTVVLAYAPSASGSFADAALFDSFDGAANRQISRDLTGTAVSITQVEAGGSHSCALYDNGTIQCWGSDSKGQLGDDATLADQAFPVAVSGITTAVEIAAGTSHTCARLSDGTVWCWGWDLSGQLGNGDPKSDSPTPVAVSGISTAVSIATGDKHSCAALSDGTARCWGEGLNGRLGDGATTDQTSPVTPIGLTSTVRVAAGGTHSCAVLSNGDLWCWGADMNGQIGNGTPTSNETTPVQVATLSGVASVALGDRHSCALLTDGSLYCWGQDSSGQLGNDASLTNQTSPVGVYGAGSVSAIAAGESHTCAVLTGTSSMTCWGSDASGQLGDDATLANQALPVVLSNGLAIATASGGGTHTVALLSNGQVAVWGADASGQLGNGSPLADQPTPAVVSSGF